MKIDYFTYEYPIDLPLGGIATYVQRASRLMATRGHSVHVFTRAMRASGRGTRSCRHSVRRRRALPEAARARTCRDVIEEPDYGALGARL